LLFCLWGCRVTITFVFIILYFLYSYVYQQFHFFNDSAFLVGRPFSSFIGPGIPPIRAQKDFLLFAAFDPDFNFEGGVVTARESSEPGFSLL
jgi:hypothetical protein